MVAPLLALLAAQALLTVAAHAVALVVTIATIRRRRPAPPPPPITHPLFDLLEPLPCSQLREIAGTRRKLRKVELLAAVVA
jgi:hypothetical protein